MAISIIKSVTTVVVVDVKAVLMGVVVVRSETESHSIAMIVDPSSGSDADSHWPYDTDGFPQSEISWYISCVSCTLGTCLYCRHHGRCETVGGRWSGSGG